MKKNAYLRTESALINDKSSLSPLALGLYKF